MADTKLTGLTELAETPASGDLIEVVDVSDTTLSADGTNKKVQYQYIVPTASTTVSGISELAIASELNTGTDTARAVTPDALAGSSLGKRVIMLKIFDDTTALATGDGKLIFPITTEFNGMNLVDADAHVSTVSSSGTPTVMIRNVTDAQDMLSTAITIDANEKTSYTAATAPVINGTYDDVATGDEIAIDVDVTGTGSKGLTVMLSFQLP